MWSISGSRVLTRWGTPTLVCLALCMANTPARGADGETACTDQGALLAGGGPASGPMSGGGCACEHDIGGAFGSCAQDGFCDIQDFFHVLDCIAGASSCPGNACDINCDGTVDLIDAYYPLCCFSGICGFGDCTVFEPTGACCFDLGNGPECSPSTESICLDPNVGGTYFGDGTSCGSLPGCCGDAACDDGNPCTTSTCNLTTGSCETVLVDCSDGDPCTENVCNQGTGLCDAFPVQCDDQLYCNGTEVCDFALGCQSASAGPCTDPMFPNCDEFTQTCFESGGGGNNCCDTGHGSGCAGNASLEACVCATDPYCCSDDWDEQCVAEVEIAGCGSCAALEVNFGGLDCNGNGIVDGCELNCGAAASRCSMVSGCGTGTDNDDNGVLDQCEVVATDPNLDTGNTTVLVPGGTPFGPLPIVGSQVEITNVSGPNGASISVSETDQNLHPGAAGLEVLGTTLFVETTLNDGQFFMTVVVSFDEGQLDGADALSANLAHFATGSGNWILAASENTANSPGHGSTVGDRFELQDTVTPTLADLSDDLGDYGVFWNTATLVGFVWANVDHTTDFAAGIAVGCAAAADCADLDGSGATDDVCTWWACNAGTCSGVAKVHPADMGGAFGDCALDTFCNLADALHALTCFSGDNACDSINIDAGGAFGSCVPDGFCNLADALHALTCFSGDNACVCGPSPEGTPEPNVVGAVSLTAAADRSEVEPGDEFTVRVSVDAVSQEVGRGSRAFPLRAYQLDVAVSGGRRGLLELVDIEIEDGKGFVFAGENESFDAFNVANGQMLAGLFAGSVALRDSGYLATFTYRASPDAVGTFVVDVLYNERNQDQTFLVGVEQTDKIEVAGTHPAIVTVTPGTCASCKIHPSGNGRVE